MNIIDPRIKLWLDMAGFLAEVAEAGVKNAAKKLKPNRQGSFTTRKPGLETPMWNACVALAREELKAYGAKARLARYLGIPKQRLHDYLKGESRMPDAEIAFQMLSWLAHKRAGQDLSL